VRWQKDKDKDKEREIVRAILFLNFPAKMKKTRTVQERVVYHGVNNP
jgi:hypothetical protein